MQIREERPADYEAIREVNRRAFGSEDEPQLVDRLRTAGLAVASLVAEDAGEIVGHILFTDLPIQNGDVLIPAVALAPMAVVPEGQRCGIGSALVRRGLELCRERGKAVVMVVGHPAYYPRFGFSAQLAQHLRAPFSGEAFMALELTAGVLNGVTGSVKYPEAFGPLE